MKIEKVGQEVKPGFFKSTYKSVPLVGDEKKMETRFKIENGIVDGTYDIYDIVADLANAFNELKSGVVDGPYSKKWDDRQEIIKTIINN